MPNVLTMPDQRAGAMPDDWNTLVWGLELTEDLLPVVSNLDAELAPGSTLKGLGKVPSLYNGSRRVVGISKWTDHVTTLNEISTWQKEKDYGICIQSRRVRALDIDIANADQAHAVAGFITRWLGFALPRRGRSNSPKFLFPFRCAGALSKRRFATSEGIIEFLGTGQQFIACGTHTSGARYEWEGGLPQDIPELELETFEELWAALNTEFGVEPSTTTKVSTRHEVLNNAIVVDPIAQHLIAAHLVLGIGADKKMNIVCPWKEQHSMDSGDTETVYYPAHTNGHAHGAFKCLHAGCEKRSQQAFLDAVGFQAPDMFEDIVDEPEAEDAPKLKYQAIRTDAMRLRDPPEWLVKKLVPKTTVGMIFGASGSGKSFFALDMAMAIARGIDWRDRKVAQTSVMYVCAEDAHGFMQRVHAYEHQHGLTPGAHPFYFLDAAPNLMQKQDAIDLARSIKACGAELVFIDTLAQTSPGADENSGKDMGLYLAFCKEIHKATGAMVTLVHHSGKDNSKGARGWSGMFGAMDFVVEVIRVDSYRSAKLVKIKGGAEGAEFPFELHQVVLGEDKDGEDITSCVLLHNAGTVRPEKAKKDPAIGGKQALALRLMGEIAFDPEVGVKASDLIDAMIEQTVAYDPKKDHRSNFSRALDALVARQILVLNDGSLTFKGNSNE